MKVFLVSFFVLFSAFSYAQIDKHLIIDSSSVSPFESKEVEPRIELDPNSTQLLLSKGFGMALLDDSLSTADDSLALHEIKDERIDLLIEDYVYKKKTHGFRIQIFLSGTNWEAMKVRSEFLKKYEGEKSYVIYQAPNFKVRVGNYMSRLAAAKQLELIRVDFPSSFIVNDEIEPQLD